MNFFKSKSRPKERILHTFEAGRRGKPDEFETGIANLIGAHLLDIDPNVRFDIRVNGGFERTTSKDLIRITGEVSKSILDNHNLYNNLDHIIRKRYNNIYRASFTDETLQTHIGFTQQSDPLEQNRNAGDSGTSIAVAYKLGPHFLPWERYLAVHIRDILDYIFQNDGLIPPELTEYLSFLNFHGLRSDGKVEVGCVYLGSQLESLDYVALAIEHEKTLSVEELREKVAQIINATILRINRDFKTQLNIPLITINSAGPWNLGGWEVDAGSREAKPYRDGFASYGVCEDSFSGEDPTKPSGTGTMLARHVAASIVSQDLADFARVMLHYKIGTELPRINITTNQSTKKTQQELEDFALKNFKLSIPDGIKQFNLRSPKTFYKIIKNSDYFQDPEYLWNQPP